MGEGFPLQINHLAKSNQTHGDLAMLQHPVELLLTACGERKKSVQQTCFPLQTLC